MGCCEGKLPNPDEQLAPNRRGLKLHGVAPPRETITRFGLPLMPELIQFGACQSVSTGS